MPSWFPFFILSDCIIVNMLRKMFGFKIMIKDGCCKNVTHACVFGMCIKQSIVIILNVVLIIHNISQEG